MGFRERVARILAPQLMDANQVKALVSEEVKQATAAMPIMADYDPRGEGYRPLTGQSMGLQDMSVITRHRMFSIAYYMWDASAMLKRMATMDRGFLFGEPVTIVVPDEEAEKVVQRFWKRNQMDLTLPDLCMWMGLLGEQCWPVDVSKTNGEVTLLYEAPERVKDVHVNPRNTREVWQVEMLGTAGRTGPKFPVIREDLNPLSRTYGRLVGECFWWHLNGPPNSPRGRSDYLTLFDWIDALERYGFNFLERAENMLNFIWDVLVKGADENQIRDFLSKNKAPQPNSIRAHNEQVEWNAVSPSLNAGDMKSGFDMGKGFIMGAAGRPESWFGGGGKAYQTEAEQFGQVPIKDLDQRQLFIKHMVTTVVRFVLDQAVIAGRLTDQQAAEFEVLMAEISKKDLTKLINGLPQLANALVAVVTSDIISLDTAIGIFALVASHLGAEVDAQEEIEKALKRRQEAETVDYNRNPPPKSGDEEPEAEPEDQEDQE
jgi:hypothetical protein